MSQQPLVSIIIPTFNRAHLIGETLDSVLAQTYQNWECIVVDDGSDDDSQAVFKMYKNKDSRFRFLNRPQNKPKGANACRNFGLENAQGHYIVFFDSDDLMLPNHLEVKVDALQDPKYDYVITKTKYFDRLDLYMEEKYKDIENHLSAENYILQKINWLTPDVCLKIKIAEKIHFNEHLKSAQEYNYFSKLALQSVNAIFVEEYVTLRREHQNSVRTNLKTKYQRYDSYFKGLWFTYQDIKVKANPNINQFLISRCAQVTIRFQSLFGISKVAFYIAIFKELGFMAVYHLMFIITIKLFSKGYWFQSHFNKLLQKNHEEFISRSV